MNGTVLPRRALRHRGPLKIERNSGGYRPGHRITQHCGTIARTRMTHVTSLHLTSQHHKHTRRDNQLTRTQQRRYTSHKHNAMSPQYTTTQHMTTQVQQSTTEHHHTAPTTQRSTLHIGYKKHNNAVTHEHDTAEHQSTTQHFTTLRSNSKNNNKVGP